MKSKTTALGHKKVLKSKVSNTCKKKNKTTEEKSDFSGSSNDVAEMILTEINRKTADKCDLSGVQNGVAEAVLTEETNKKKKNEITAEKTELSGAPNDLTETVQPEETKKKNIASAEKTDLSEAQNGVTEKINKKKKNEITAENSDLSGIPNGITETVSSEETNENIAEKSDFFGIPNDVAEKKNETTSQKSDLSGIAKDVTETVLTGKTNGKKKNEASAEKSDLSQVSNDVAKNVLTVKTTSKKKHETTAEKLNFTEVPSDVTETVLTKKANRKIKNEISAEKSYLSGIPNDVSETISPNNREKGIKTGTEKYDLSQVSNYAPETVLTKKTISKKENETTVEKFEVTGISNQADTILEKANRKKKNETAAEKSDLSGMLSDETETVLTEEETNSSNQVDHFFALNESLIFGDVPENTNTLKSLLSDVTSKEIHDIQKNSNETEFVPKYRSMASHKLYSSFIKYSVGDVLNPDKAMHTDFKSYSSKNYLRNKDIYKPTNDFSHSANNNLSPSYACNSNDKMMGNDIPDVPNHDETSCENVSNSVKNRVFLVRFPVNLNKSPKSLEKDKELVETELTQVVEKIAKSGIPLLAEDNLSNSTEPEPVPEETPIAFMAQNSQNKSKKRSKAKTIKQCIRNMKIEKVKSLPVKKKLLMDDRKIEKMQPRVSLMNFLDNEDAFKEQLKDIKDVSYVNKIIRSAAYNDIKNNKSSDILNINAVSSINSAVSKKTMKPNSKITAKKIKNARLTNNDEPVLSKLKKSNNNATKMQSLTSDINQEIFPENLNNNAAAINSPISNDETIKDISSTSSKKNTKIQNFGKSANSLRKNTASCSKSALKRSLACKDIVSSSVLEDLDDTIGLKPEKKLKSNVQDSVSSKSKKKIMNSEASACDEIKSSETVRKDVRKHLSLMDMLKLYSEKNNLLSDANVPPIQKDFNSDFLADSKKNGIKTSLSSKKQNKPALPNCEKVINKSKDSEQVILNGSEIFDDIDSTLVIKSKRRGRKPLHKTIVNVPPLQKDFNSDLLADSKNNGIKTSLLSKKRNKSVLPNCEKVINKSEDLEQLISNGSEVFDDIDSTPVIKSKKRGRKALHKTTAKSRSSWRNSRLENPALSQCPGNSDEVNSRKSQLQNKRLKRSPSSEPKLFLNESKVSTSEKLGHLSKNTHSSHFSEQSNTNELSESEKSNSAESDLHIKGSSQNLTYENSIPSMQNSCMSFPLMPPNYQTYFNPANNSLILGSPIVQYPQLMNQRMLPNLNQFIVQPQAPYPMQNMFGNFAVSPYNSFAMPQPLVTYPIYQTRPFLQPSNIQCSNTLNTNFKFDSGILGLSTPNTSISTNPNNIGMGLNFPNVMNSNNTVSRPVIKKVKKFRIVSQANLTTRQRLESLRIPIKMKKFSKICNETEGNVKKRSVMNVLSDAENWFCHQPSYSNITVKQLFSKPTFLKILDERICETIPEFEIPPKVEYVFPDSFFESSVREVIKDYAEFHVQNIYKGPACKEFFVKCAYRKFPFRDCTYLCEAFPKENETFKLKDLVSYLSFAALLAILDECKKRKLL